jgi:hypothetical protein
MLQFTKTTLKFSEINRNPDVLCRDILESGVAFLVDSMKNHLNVISMAVRAPIGPNTQYDLIDGNHRYEAIKALISEGELPADFEVGVSVYPESTSDRLCRQIASELNACERLNVPVTLLENFKAFLRMVLEPVDRDDFDKTPGWSDIVERVRLAELPDVVVTGVLVLITLGPC